jgi:membrane-bound metal-dependent hydrolase YbcI (DUF457 family)
MKNAIIKYGLIAGGISAVCQFTVGLVLKFTASKNASFDYSAYVGYTLIILSMAMIYFGVKAFRDQENEGKLSFSQGIGVGLGIAAISCVCYSLMWMVVYYNFVPNFWDDYAQYYTEKLKTEGANAELIQKTQSEIASYKDMYKSPLVIFAMTLLEPLWIGVIIALVAAFVLKQK